MQDIRIIKGIQIMPDQDTALALAGYKKGTPAWADGVALFAKLQLALRRSIQPKGAVAFAADGRKQQGLYMMLTLGPGVTKQAERLMADHQFTEDLVFNAMADTCLFALEKQVLQQLPRLCAERRVGIAGRHESGVDIPLSVNRDAYEAVAAKRTLGITLTDDLVFIPEKTMCVVFDLSDDTNEMNMTHSCSSCRKLDCPNRQEAAEVDCPEGVNVLDYLQGEGVPVEAPCGGKGVCGKCAVQVIKGTLPVTPEDKAFFSPDELADGYRLACRAETTEEITVAVTEHDEGSFAALGMTDDESAQRLPLDHHTGIAIDIGSTTLAASLVDITAGQVLYTVTSVNHQRRFGADVISRIQVANSGHGEALQQSVRDDIASLCAQLGRQYPLLPRTYTGLAIAGNTTMEHLLMGYSCKGLGSWPFAPVSLGGETVSGKEALGNVGMPWLTNQPVTLLPGISTYVGADITAGIYHCHMLEDEGLSLLLDLGTNGEMALGNKDTLFVASTPAGPALEGGNLSCGTGSISGAINTVTIRHGRAYVDTIDHAAPVGVCGTGVIECVAGLAEQGLIDENGTLREPYFTNGGFRLGETDEGEEIILTQQDIREIQMAKSAIRAGLETLLKTCGAAYDDIHHVYLAGGFGFYLKPDRAAAMGLLPRELVDRTEAVGNTPLAGAVDTLLQPKALQAMKDIQGKAKEIVLGNTPLFQELYIHYMGFEGAGK